MNSPNLSFRLKPYPVEKRSFSKTGLPVRNGEIHENILYNPMSAQYADERDASTSLGMTDKDC
jgi:hypothetical protein